MGKWAAERHLALIKSSCEAVYSGAEVEQCIQQSIQREMTSSRKSQPITLQGDKSGKVYTADECVGAIVNGVCHGSIVPKAGRHKTCYGQMINGRCTGAMY